MQNSSSEKTFEVIAGEAWHMSKQKTVLPFFPPVQTWAATIHLFNIKTHNKYKLKMNPMFHNLFRESSLYFTFRNSWNNSYNHQSFTNITASKIIPCSLLYHRVNCGKKDDFRCTWEYADTAHFGSQSLTVNHSKAYKIWILSQYSQFSAPGHRFPDSKFITHYYLCNLTVAWWLFQMPFYGGNSYLAFWMPSLWL